MSTKVLIVNSILSFVWKRVIIKLVMSLLGACINTTQNASIYLSYY